MRNLVLIGSVLIGLGEFGYISYVFSPLSMLVQIPLAFALVVATLWFLLFTGTFWLLIISSDRFETPFFPGLGRLIQTTNNPHRTRLWANWVYSFSVRLNSIVLAFGFAAVLVTKTWSPTWGFVAGISTILVLYYDRLVISQLGQRSEDNAGSSFVLVASLGWLSARLFSRRNRLGLAPLLQALKMAGVLFYRRRYRPALLPAVETTVEGLVDLEEEYVPFVELEELASSLTLLPRREGLHPAFDKFLRDMKWPGGFERVERRRMSSYELLTIAVFTIGAFGGLLVIIPRTVQEGFYNQVVSFIGLQGWSIVGVAMLFVGMFYGPIVTKYDTFFRFLIRGFTRGPSIAN